MEFLWDEGECHFHVLWAVERCLEVKLSDVGADIVGVFCTDDAVPHDLGSGEVNRVCGEFAGVVDEIATDSDVHAIWDILLCTVVNNYPSLSNSAVGRDVVNFYQDDEAHCVLTSE